MILTAQIICLAVLIGYGFISFRKYPFRMEIKPMVQISFLLVLALALSYFSLMVGVFGFPSLKIGLAQVPLILIGSLYGPGYGFIAGLIYDVLGLIVTPTDLPFLGFTLGNVLVCSVPGWIMDCVKLSSYKKVRFGVIAATVLMSAFLCGSMWIMKENFPFKMTENERTAVTVFACVYPFLMWAAMKIMEKHQSGQKEDICLLLSVLAVDAVINLFLNPLWLQIMYGIPYFASFALRLVKLLAVVPADGIFVTVLYNVSKRFRRR